MRRGSFHIAAVAAVSVGVAYAGGGKAIEVKPGPALMTSAEKEISADLAKGVQHGVILVEETVQNDNLGFGSETDYHLRAKILSPEARALADIAIPIARGVGDLKSFWGKTLLPDGSVLELPQAELKSQTIAKSSLGEIVEFKGALPGVVPGCVIDYGYVVKQTAFNDSKRVFFQREWPVQLFRYQWIPNQHASGAYATSHAEGRAIGVQRDGRSILVTGHDLEPVPNEPLMPPLDAVRASATFYYTSEVSAEVYWDLIAQSVDDNVKGFLGGSSAVKNMLASAAIPPDASLSDKLKRAYDWLGNALRNTVLLSAEEEEAGFGRIKDVDDANRVLQARQASPVQLAYLFIGMARALGAEANIVFAVDRTDRLWNKALKSTAQFRYALVAVRAPGAPDDAVAFVSPGSGLPYGQVPWRATGAPALICTPKKSSALTIPPSSPTVNRADAHVTLSFSDDNETIHAKWDRTAVGATGAHYRRWLRNLDTQERKETLDQLCGATGTTEVAAAELPGLEEWSAPFNMACESDRTDANVSSDLARYSLSVMGAWWPDTPEFTAAKRAHMVVFDYPRVDIVGIDIAAPRGFKPKDPPAPVTLESPYGRYQFVVAKTPTGFHVDRAFVLTVLTAKPDEYEALRKFFADIRKADQTDVMFARDTSAP